jgi:hypothetical protein
MATPAIETVVAIDDRAAGGSSASGMTWSAILGGAFAAGAITLMLLMLGSAIGWASISPWSGEGASATTFGVWAAIWLIIVQWVSSGIGGYLTGRLRTKWVGVHTHEVFFRDTAHGFLAWAVATVVVFGVLGIAASMVAAGGAAAVTGVASGAAQGATQGAVQSDTGSGPAAYLTDMLFRSDRVATDSSAPEARAEGGRILAASLAGGGEIAPGDKTYLAQLVAARTGLAQPDAEKRVDDVMAQAKAAADKARQVADDARKAVATASLFTFFSLLIGAFIASAAGALGGRQRDDLEEVYAVR